MNRLFSIYDVKAEFFGNPFVARNAADAGRSFQQAAEDPQTMISKNPDDFILYELGGFDMDTGSIISNESKVNLGSAANYQRKKDQ